MAEMVERELERMVPDLEELAARGVWSREEVAAIVRRRRDFEYLLLKRVGEEADVVRYIEYELSLEALRRARTARLGFTRAVPADFAGIRRVHSIFERALRKYRFQARWWLQWHAYAVRVGSVKTAERVLARALTLLPRSVEVWLAAAAWHFNQQHEPGVARALLQRAVRVNPDSAALWTALFRFECAYMMRIRGRRWVQGLDTVVVLPLSTLPSLVSDAALSGLGSDVSLGRGAGEAPMLMEAPPDGPVAPGMEGMEEELAAAASAPGDGGGSAVTSASVMEGYVPMQVHDAALAASPALAGPGGLPFRLGLLAVAEEFQDTLAAALMPGGDGEGKDAFIPLQPAFPAVTAHILAALATAFPTHPAAWRAMTLTPLRRVADACAQWSAWHRGGGGTSKRRRVTHAAASGSGVGDEGGDLATASDADLFVIDAAAGHVGDGDEAGEKEEVKGDGSRGRVGASPSDGGRDAQSWLRPDLPPPWATTPLGSHLPALLSGGAVAGDGRDGWARFLASGQFDAGLVEHLADVIHRCNPPVYASLDRERAAPASGGTADSLPSADALVPPLVHALVVHPLPADEPLPPYFAPLPPAATTAPPSSPGAAVGMKRTRRATAAAAKAITSLPAKASDGAGGVGDSGVAVDPEVAGLVAAAGVAFDEAVSTLKSTSTPDLLPVLVEVHTAAWNLPLPRAAATAFHARVLTSLWEVCSTDAAVATGDVGVATAVLVAGLRLGRFAAAAATLRRYVDAAPVSHRPAMHLLRLRVMAGVEAACHAAGGDDVTMSALAAAFLPPAPTTATGPRLPLRVTAAAAGAAVAGGGDGGAAAGLGLVHALLVGAGAPEPAAVQLAARVVSGWTSPATPAVSIDDGKAMVATAVAAAVAAGGGEGDQWCGLVTRILGHGSTGWPAFAHALSVLGAVKGHPSTVQTRCMEAAWRAAVAQHGSNRAGLWIAYFRWAKAAAAHAPGSAPAITAEVVYRQALRALEAGGSDVVAMFVEGVSRA